MPAVFSGAQAPTTKWRHEEGGTRFLTLNSTVTTGTGAKAVSSGKYYFELVCKVRSTATAGVGVISSAASVAGSIGAVSNGYEYQSDGNKKNNASASAYGATWTTNDILGVAVDLTNGAIWFSKNGSWQGGAVIAEINSDDTTNAAYTFTPSGSYRFAVSGAKPSTNSDEFVIAETLTYTVPTGYASGWPAPNPVTSASATAAKFDSARHGSNASLSVDSSSITVVDGLGARTRGGANNIPVSGGKYYWEVFVAEVHASSSEYTAQVGVADASVSWTSTSSLGAESLAYVYCADGQKQNNNSSSSYGTAYTPGDVIGVALDLDNGAVWFSKNGVWQNGALLADIQAGTTADAAYTGLSGSFVAAVTAGYQSGAGACNSCFVLVTDSSDFLYSVPPGFTEGLAQATNDGAVEVAVIVAGTADVQPIHSDGGASVSIIAAGSGDVQPLHGDGAVTLAPSVAGTASLFPHHGAGSVSLAPVAAGTATVSVGGSGAVGIDLVAAGTGTRSPRFNAAFSLPSPLDVTAVLLVGDAVTVEGTLPSLTGAGTALAGGRATLSESLPLVTVEAYGPTTGAITLPSLTATGAGYTGTVATLAATLPQLSVTAAGSPDRTVTAAVTLPRLTAAGVVANHAPATAALSLPKLKLSAAATAGGLATLAVTLPSLEGESGARVENVLTAAVVLPRLSLVGAVNDGHTLTATAWVMNTENLATTNYTNYGFHTIGMVGGVPVGITASGVYTLSGDNDAGALIDAQFLTGLDDFGLPNEKNVDKLYVGFESPGTLIILSKSDGQEDLRENEVTHISHDGGVKRGRATLGKGVRSRYWQLGAKNCYGSDFQIESLEALFRQLKRKV